MSEAQEFLKGIELLDAKIDARQCEIDDLKEKLLHITPTLSLDKGGGGGYAHDKMAGTMARIVDLQALINDEIDRLVDQKAEAMNMLNSMKNPVHMTILHRRYFLHHSFEQIATDMKYTYRWVTRLHGRALQDFAKVMQERESEGDEA